MKNTAKIFLMSGFIAIFLTGCSNVTTDQSGANQTLSKQAQSKTETSVIPQTPAPVVTQAPSTEINPNAKYEVSLNKDNTKFIVTKDGKDFVTGNVSGIMPGTNGDEEVAILKQTPKNLYVQTCATGFGGYILYKFCYGSVYKVDLSTAAVTDYKLAHVLDISDDETMAASVDISKKKIIITNLSTKTSSTFEVDSKFNQFGDMKFSPKSDKFAYAAAVGEPGAESGVVISVDLKSKKQTQVAKTKGSDNYFKVLGWKDNNTVDYKEV
ncbi:MAG: hypothetical protein WC843_05045 [Candidatus Gracilibacteria bacterium]|jgi:hypothetical protein